MRIKVTKRLEQEVGKSEINLKDIAKLLVRRAIPYSGDKLLLRDRKRIIEEEPEFRVQTTALITGTIGAKYILYAQLIYSIIDHFL